MADLEKVCLEGFCGELPNRNNFYTKSETDTLLESKQNNLIAGDNIQLDGNTISATDTQYVAGDNITIEGNVISATGGGGDVTGVRGAKESSYRTGDVTLSPANIGAVNLEGDTMIGDLARRVNTVDVKQANNGTASTQASGIIFGQDKNGVNYSFLDAYARADGSISTVLFARNYNTDGSIAADGRLQFYTAKNGSVNAEIVATLPASNDSSIKIATTEWVQIAINRRLPQSTNVNYTNTTARNIANNTNVLWDIWTAPANGIIIATNTLSFSANTAGYRQTDIFVNNNGVGVGDIRGASQSGVTRTVLTIARHINNGEKVQTQVRQNSGATLQIATQYFHGIFIYD